MWSALPTHVSQFIGSYYTSCGSASGVVSEKMATSGTSSSIYDPAVIFFRGERRVGTFKTIINFWNLDLFASHIQSRWSIWEAEFVAQPRRSPGDPECLGRPNCLETVAPVEDKSERNWCNCPWHSTTIERVAEDDQKNLGKPSRVAIPDIFDKIGIASGHNTKWNQCVAVCMPLAGRVGTTYPYQKNVLEFEMIHKSRNFKKPRSRRFLNWWN